MERNVVNKDTFFTRKKIITLSICFVIFVAVILLTSKFFLNIEFNTIGTLFKSSYDNNNLFFLWLFLLVLFPLYNCFLRIYVYWYKLKKKWIHVKWYDWLIFCFITFFIGGITPFAMGSEPYIIYWLKKRGLSLQDSTAIVASFTVLNPYIQILITWPSFFIVCADYSKFANIPEWVGSFWSVFVGLVIDLMGTTFWLLLSSSKNAHYWINVLINKSKKIMHMSYKSNDEIRMEFKENGSFKNKFINEMKDYKFVIFVVISSVGYNALYYCSMIFSFNLLAPNLGFNPGDLFNYTNIATTANNFIPIPGAEGTLQAVILMFIQHSGHVPNLSTDALKQVTDNSVFVWRSFTFYITTILGALALIILIIKELYKHQLSKYRNKLHHASYLIKENKHPIIFNAFNIEPNQRNNSYQIIIYNNNSHLLKDTLNSINKFDYNFDLVDVIIYTNSKIDDNLLNTYPNLKVRVIEGQLNNKLLVLKYLINRNLIHHEYINLLESGDWINNEIIKKINYSLIKYDVYMCQYKMIKNHKLSKTIKPFINHFKKVFDESNEKSTPNFNFASCFIKTDIINKIFNQQLSITNDWIFLNQLIELSHNIKYIKRLSSYKVNNLDKIDENIIRDLLKVNQELAILLMYKNKNKDVVLKQNDLVLNKKVSFKWLPWYYHLPFACYYKFFVYKKCVQH